MPQPHQQPSSPTTSGSAPDGKDKSPLLRNSVVKERDLEQFDKLDISEESGWARSSVNVDYSEKLIFSDDEDNIQAKDMRLLIAWDEYCQVSMSQVFYLAHFSSF